jgi:hypothetical protein
MRKQTILFSLVILLCIVGVYALITSTTTTEILNHCDKYEWTNTLGIKNSAECNLLKALFENLTEDEINFQYGNFLNYSKLDFSNCRVCSNISKIQANRIIEIDQIGGNMKLICTRESVIRNEKTPDGMLISDYFIRCKIA